ncbi:ABC transporter permease [Fictibacillus iocasae]|uniref:ABC transporter permease n=1 Tax=Fictibacillus iocasae TaxID=2715437 RepID=A0ABW2NQ57_9BACL
MRLIFLLASNTIRSWLRNPVPLLITLLFPVVLLVILYTGLQPLLKEKQWIEPFPVAIVDHEQTFETKLLLKQYQKSEELKKLMTFSVLSEDKAMQKLKNNEIAGIAIIPEGFTESLWTGKNMPVGVITNDRRGFQAKLFREFMATNAKLISAAQAGANAAYDYSKQLPITESELKKQRKQIATKLTLHALDRNQFFTNEEVSVYSGTNQQSYYALSGMLLLLLITGIFTIKMTKPNEQQALQDRLALYGVSSTEMTWSRFWSGMFLLLLQAGVLGGMFYAVTKHFNMIAALVLLVYLIAIGAMFSLITELFTKETAALLAGMTVTATATILGGVLFPASLLPEKWQNISEYSIMSLAQNGMLDALYGSGNIPLQTLTKLAGTAAILLLAKQLLIKLKKRDLWAQQPQSPSTVYESS